VKREAKRFGEWIGKQKRSYLGDFHGRETGYQSGRDASRERGAVAAGAAELGYYDASGNSVGNMSLYQASLSSAPCLTRSF
jgi:hypothetical protein